MGIKGVANMAMIRIKKDVIENWLKNKSTSPRTIEEIAISINVSPSLLFLIMSGKRQVTPNIQRKLCALTGYDIGDICFYDRNNDAEENDD